MKFAKEQFLQVDLFVNQINSLNRLFETGAMSKQEYDDKVKEHHSFCDSFAQDLAKVEFSSSFGDATESSHSLTGIFTATPPKDMPEAYRTEQQYVITVWRQRTEDGSNWTVFKKIDIARFERVSSIPFEVLTTQHNKNMLDMFFETHQNDALLAARAKQLSSMSWYMFDDCHTGAYFNGIGVLTTFVIGFNSEGCIERIRKSINY